ncbi:MAG: GLPGLI family protein [Bacteroidota bacterium]
MKGMVIKYTAAVLFVLLSSGIGAQVMHSGEVVFERKTNLEKRFEDSERNGWMDGNLKKPKIDEFVLYFTDSVSLFKPILPEVPDEREWATMMNTSYQNFNSNVLEQEFSFWGSKVHLRDSIKTREWYITGSSRVIAGYECRQAMWEANDSTRIYAWFAEQLIPSVGPETFNGLPGVMLGLAIEDGGVVYFAKEVRPLETNIEKEVPRVKKKEYFSEEELRAKIKERFSDWGSVDRVIFDMFVW